MNYELVNYANTFSSWLHQSAYPLWFEHGVDWQAGGFHEALGKDGLPVPQTRRSRVQPRQIYAFIQAGLSGWGGPWQDVIERGLYYFDRVFLRPDGTYGNIASDKGVLLDEGYDLYNQAFAIFSFANAALASPSRAHDFQLRAESLLSLIELRTQHPLGGFHEAETLVLPLRSNPHMHLFEAALCWETVPGITATRWRRLADELAHLCMSRFIDRRTGALREFFDANWEPYPGHLGRRIEPGHQFEWAWLIARWAKARQRRDALSVARRLFDIGVYHGICPRRDVAVMAINDDFTVEDDIARLWPQTEWLKAALGLAEHSSGLDRSFYLSSANQACHALSLFLDTPLRGLWHDKLYADGRFLDEPSPASSFYHIVCAILELERTCRLEADLPYMNPAFQVGEIGLPRDVTV